MNDQSPLRDDVLLKGTLTVVVRRPGGAPCPGRKVVIHGCGFAWGGTTAVTNRRGVASVEAPLGKVEVLVDGIRSEAWIPVDVDVLVEVTVAWGRAGLMSRSSRRTPQRRSRLKVKDVGRAAVLDMTRTFGSGATIVEAMMVRYTRMRSYRDEGLVRTDLRPSGSSSETRFDTAFSAPDLFRFSFARPHPFPALRHVISRCIVGSDGAQAYLWTQHADDVAKLWVDSDVSTVVAGATGISSGAAHTIARLLLPRVGGWALDQMRDLSVVGEVEIGGIACHKIAGSNPRGERCEIVIEVESLLLRRLSHGPGQLTQEEERWAIRVDELLDAETFAVPAVT